jgi:hypothetical protein
MSEPQPVMSHTKWDELRLGLYDLGNLAPSYRTKSITNGHVTRWDSEWFYHFRDTDGTYNYCEWVEIRIETPEQDAAVLAVLKTVHVPGHRIEGGFRVYGYSRTGEPLDYI